MDRSVELFRMMEANGGFAYFCKLADRWSHESQYEDIKDYQKVIQKRYDECFPSDNIKVARMTRRPFGYTIRVGAEEATVKFLLKGSKISVEMFHRKVA